MSKSMDSMTLTRDDIHVILHILWILTETTNQVTPLKPPYPTVNPGLGVSYDMELQCSLEQNYYYWLYLVDAVLVRNMALSIKQCLIENA